MTDNLDPDEKREIEDILRELHNELRQLERRQCIPLAELFPAEFMQTHTDTMDIEQPILRSDLFTSKDISGGAINCTYCEIVDEHTSFSSWEEMLTTAVQR